MHRLIASRFELRSFEEGDRSGFTFVGDKELVKEFCVEIDLRTKESWLMNLFMGSSERNGKALPNIQFKSLDVRRQ